MKFPTAHADDIPAMIRPLHNAANPWARKFARMMRRKYGINVWVDGTVTRGWRLLVHRSDGDRASRMFKNVS